MTTQEFLKLQRQHKEAEQRASESAGAYKQVEDELRSKFKCSVKEAHKKVKALEASIKQITNEITKASIAFEKLWGEWIENESE